MLEKMKPFLVEEPASWHVSSEEPRKTDKPASKFGFCLVTSRMISFTQTSNNSENEIVIIRVTYGFYSWAFYILSTIK